MAWPMVGELMVGELMTGKPTVARLAVVRPVATSPRGRWGCWASALRPPRWWSRSRGWGSTRSGNWRRWGAMRWSIASAPRERSRGAWRAVKMSRCAPASPRSACRSRWNSTRPTPGRRWSACSAMLLDRLLARSERRGRTLRTLTVSARLVEGGTWRERVVLREALSDSRRIRLALAPRLALLPAPAAALCLEAERFGPPEGAQGTLLDGCPCRPIADRKRRTARERRWPKCARPLARRRLCAQCASTLTRVCRSDGSSSPPSRDESQPYAQPASSRARADGRRRSAPAQWMAGESSRCESRGWWRIAGGPAGRCVAAIGRW